MMNEERINDLFNDLVEDLELDYGNGGADGFEDDGRFLGYIEAPNNTTLTVDITFDPEEEFTDDEIEEKLEEGIKHAIYDFDPEETFEELWHPGFEIRAFRFVDMLKNDEEFFEGINEKMLRRKNLK